MKKKLRLAIISDISRRVLHQYQSHLGSSVLGMGITIVFLAFSYMFFHTPESVRSSWGLMALDRIHTLSFDLRHRWVGTIQPAENLALVAIDEASVKELGRWPWSRKTIVDLVDRLFDYGATSVALDIMYTEAAESDVLNWFQDNQSVATEGLVHQARQIFDEDAAFEGMIQRHRNRIILSSTYNSRTIALAPYQEVCQQEAFKMSPSYKAFKSERSDIIVLNQAATKAQRLPRKVKKRLRGFLKDSPESERLSYCRRWLTGQDPYLKKYIEVWSREEMEKFRSAFLYPAIYPAGEWIYSLQKFTNASRYSGFINIHPEIDGTIRRAQLIVRAGKYVLPSMALRASMMAKDSSAGQVILNVNPLSPTDLEVHGLELTDQEGKVLESFKVDSNGRHFIRFAGRKYSYPHVSVRDILDDQSTIKYVQRNSGPRENWKSESDRREFFKGKTVVLGATAVGLYDMRVTPFDENIPGPEIHLNIIDNILNAQGFVASQQEPIYIYGLIVALGFVFTVAVVMFPIYLSAMVCLLLTLAVVLIDLFWFFQQGTIVAIWLPFGLCVVTYFTLTLFNHFQSEKKRKEIRRTFESYVSPSIVDEVLADPENIRLGGRKVHMSVFFSDVRGFTTISEELSPEDLSKVLNMYLTPMTELVFENRGTLDKYMGDAVMAFFGAPIPYQEHAGAACRCALMSVRKLEELNVRLKKLKFPTLDIGIGINTGSMSVGNMGSETVRSYTVMGDSVNLASRLEGINKQYGTRIIISEFTHEELGEEFTTREIDLVKVKGKNKPVRIFELISDQKLSSDEVRAIRLFETGYRLYHERDWLKAMGYFKQCIEVAGEDPVAELFLKRSTQFYETPPPADWDGVYVMTTK